MQQKYDFIMYDNGINWAIIFTGEQHRYRNKYNTK